jgi:hypothetical protein
MSGDYVESRSPAPEEGTEGVSDPLRIEDVIAGLTVKQVQLSTLIDECLAAEEPRVDQVARLMALHGQNAARLGRLLRDQKALGTSASDELTAAVSQALDELSTELEIDL